MEFEYIWWPLSFASANRLWDPLHPWQIWQVGLNGTNTVAPGEASTNSTLISLWFYWLANQNSRFERAFTRLLSDRKIVLAALLGFINLFHEYRSAGRLLDVVSNRNDGTIVLEVLASSVCPIQQHKYCNPLTSFDQTPEDCILRTLRILGPCASCSVSAMWICVWLAYPHRSH